MKGYKKLMDIVAMVEKTVLVVTMILILVLTVGNVFSRKVIHQSWSFTEELVVAIFVLITLLGAALSAREGGLVGLNLVTERLPKSAKKPVAQPETEHLEPARYHMIMKVVHKSGNLRQQVIVLRIIALIRSKSLDRKERQDEQASRYKKRAHSRMVPFKSSDCRRDCTA